MKNYIAIILITTLFSCSNKDNDTVDDLFFRNKIINNDSISNINLPTVNTNSISNISQTSATSGGNVTSIGSSAVTSRGVCWSTSQDPTTANSTSGNGSGLGSFTSSLTGLIQNTTYYVRAFAINSSGISYGNQVSFTTTQNATLPTLTTNSVSSITQTSATSGGNIISIGSSSVTSRGVCWSTSQNPTTANSTSGNGSGLGSFTSSLTGLTQNTTYYVRAFAINSFGTSYGNQVSFTTSSSTTSSQICCWTALSSFPCSNASIDVFIDDNYVGSVVSYYVSAPSCGASGTVTINVTPGTHKIYAKCNLGTTQWGPVVKDVPSGQCYKLQLQ